MTENWGVQASFKTPGGTLINVRGDDNDMLATRLLNIAEQVPLILSVEKAITAVQAVEQHAGIGAPMAQYEAQEAATQHQLHQPPPNVVQFPPAQQPAPQDPWNPGQPMPPQYPQYPQQPGAFPAPATQVGAPTPAPVPLPGASAPAAAPSIPGLVCEHGQPAKVVPAGISKKTGQPYRAFAVCPLDKQYQCNFRKTL